MSGESQRCQAKTQSGSQCKNSALDGSAYCHIHQGQPEPQTASKPVSKSASKPAVSSTQTSNAGATATPAPQSASPMAVDADERNEIERFKAAILGRAK